MWESGVEDALTVGVPYDLYWGRMTPKLFKKYLSAYTKRQKDLLYLQDTANHVLGIYIRTAVSDVLSGKDKYPKRPLIEKSQEKQSEGMTDAEMIRMAQRNTAVLTGIANAKALQKKEDNG